MRTVSSLSNNNERHYSKSTYCVINFRVYEKGLCCEKAMLLRSSSVKN